MGAFSSGGVGIDLGSANITICLENEGVVLREPSYILALREDSEEIYQDIWKKYLSPCISMIEAGKKEDCKELYIEMVEKLREEYFYLQ